MIRTIILTFLFSCTASDDTVAQSVQEEIRADVNRSAGTFLAYLAPQQSTMTPPPDGKKPFFLSHYGCQGSYYLDKQDYIFY